MEDLYEIVHIDGLTSIKVKRALKNEQFAVLFSQVAKIRFPIDGIEFSLLSNISYADLINNVRLMGGIKRLSISDCKLIAEEFLSICQGLENSTVKHLDVWNALDITAATFDWKAIGKALARTHIISLNLSANEVGVTEDVAILIENSSLQELRLGLSSFHPLNKALGRVLASSQLRTLCIVSYRTSACMFDLMTGVRDSQIGELQLFNNGLTLEALVIIGETLPACRNLRKLILEYNHITDDGANAVLRGVKGSNLAELDLSDNELTSLDHLAIAAALEEDSPLEKLSVARNYDLDSYPALAASLKKSPLRRLQLCDSMSAPGSCESISSILPLCNLIALDVSNNDLKSHFVVMIAEAILKGSKLQKLNLNGSHLDSVACAALAKTFQRTQLRELSILYMKDFSEQSWEYLRDGLVGENLNLTRLDMFQNGSPILTFSRVKQLLIDVPTLAIGYNGYCDEKGARDWFTLMPFASRINPFPMAAIDFALQCHQVRVLTTLLGAIAISRLNRESLWRLVPKELVRNLCKLLYDG